MSRDDNGLDRLGATPHQTTEYVRIEAREVFPGTVVFLGFQVGSVFLDGFQRLPVSSKYVHLASLLLVMLSTVLLLIPEGSHLLGLYRDDTPHFHRFARRAVLAGLALLAVAIAADGFVAVRVVTGSLTTALIASLVLLLVWVQAPHSDKHR